MYSIQHTCILETAGKMVDQIAVSSLSDLAERLFTKPPALQNLSPESVVRYLNTAASDIGEGLIQQLLISEHCNGPKDQKEFNEHVTTGTLLHVLAFVGRSEAVEWLLKNGAYAHTFNHVGSTALHVATLRQHPDIIKSLRFHHADSYSENKEGKTALDFGQDADDVKEALLSYRFQSESIEEEFLHERLPALLERVKTPKDSEDQLQALLCIRAEIRMATSSMTSVPKPLKFLREHFDELDACYEKLGTSPSKTLLADVLSVLAMATDDKTERKCLNYRLQGSGEKVSSFGHPYIRRLCSQIPEEWLQRSSPEDDLMSLVREICEYCLRYSAEAEACDLLMEIEKIELIVDLVTEDISDRVCLYLTSCVKYVQEPENTTLLTVALKIHKKFKQYPQALRLALMINDPVLIRQVFLECPDSVMRKQLAFMLGRQQVFLDLEEGECDDVEDIADIMSNVHLNNNFLALARELDIMEPKVPEDIYKTHLEHARFSTANTVDSARANLSSSFVNGFVNAGFCTDKLLVADGNKWIYKNKGVGMMSAAASLGLILLWDVEGGLSEIDKFLYASEDYIKAGALLACGIVNVGVRNECDPALALLSDYVLHSSSTMRLGAVIGLGLAYAGSARNDIIEVLTPVMWDANSSLEVVCLGALSCAMVAVGSCHGDLTESFLQIMMERDASDLGKTHVRYLALALALLYLGKQEAAELTIEALKVIPEPLKSFASTLLDVCAYAGTGNVLKIQSLLHTCSEFYKAKDKEGGEQAQEEGAGSTEATPTSAKPGEMVPTVSGGADDSSKTTDKPPEATADAKKTASSKDAEMKDVEQTEPGAIGEAGSHQAVCVLGIALIAMGEDIGAEMALRTFNHLLHYGDSIIRRAVPLALALLSTSNPQLPILDTLSKFSHDSDPTVARNAIFSMGLVGSGTNNARLAGLLRNLAQFYHKEPLDLFMVRLAQGLTHLGKGTLTLNPYHSDRMLMTPVAVAGFLTVLISMLDANNIILKDAHYMLYYLTPAIQPRMLVTFDEELSPLSVNVRVGQAVDVVGQAGKPKTITGFQTHTTPVLLAYGERAELATEEYLPLTPIVEGFVIIKKNPDYEES